MRRDMNEDENPSSQIGPCLSFYKPVLSQRRKISFYSYPKKSLVRKYKTRTELVSLTDRPLPKVRIFNVITYKEHNAPISFPR